MATDQLDHPAENLLLRFAIGTLSGQSWNDVASHIQRCTTCADFVKTVPDDPFVAQLRRTTDTPSHQTPATKDADDEISTQWFLPATDDDTAKILSLQQRYRILERIGQGGMGTVYKAEHTVMHRLVALKVINPALLTHSQAVQRFQSEVRAAARLLHPNIVTAYDADQFRGLSFLVMEFVDGENLAAVVKRRQKLSLSLACRCISQIAQGLQHAHEKHMVHRDIKPHNVILASDQQVKILDFGLARFVSEEHDDHGLTTSGVAMGTPDYVAPEQADNARNADIRADIYSLGCTFYYLLSGQVPFPKSTHLQKLMAHKLEQPTPIDTLRPDLPKDLTNILTRMMDKDPDRRFQTPHEVVQALRPFLTPPRKERPKTSRKPSSRRFLSWPIVMAASLAAALMVAAAILYLVTDKGTLVIRTKDKNINIAIRGNGRTIVFKDLKSDQQITLQSGQYHISPLSKDSRLRIEPKTFRILRGSKIVVEAWWKKSKTNGTDFTNTPAQSPTVRLRKIHKFHQHSNGITSVAIAPNGYLAATGSADNTICLWNLRKQELIHRFHGHSGRVLCLAFSPDGTKLLSGGGDEQVCMWSVKDQKQLFKLKGKRRIWGNAFSPDGAYFCFDADDALRDAKTGKVVRRFERPFGNATSFSPDGKRVLVGAFPSELRLHDVTSGKILHQFSLPSPGIRSVDHSPDGQYIVAAIGDGSNDGPPRPGADYSLYMWHLPSKRLIKQFRGHTHVPYSVSFSEDGNELLSAGFDRTVRLWDTKTGKELCQFDKHPSFVWGARYCLNGDYVLSVTLNGIAYLLKREDESTETASRTDDHKKKNQESLEYSILNNAQWANKTLLYEDDFDNPKSGWRNQPPNNKPARFWYEDGKYVIQAKSGTWGWNCPRAWFRNYVLEVVGSVATTEPVSWGISIHTARNKQDQGIRVTIDGKGALVVGRSPWDRGAFRKFASRIFRDDIIKKAPHFNKLIVVVRGHRLDIAVNGKVIARNLVVLGDIEASGYSLLLLAGSHHGRVEFERLRIWGLSETSKRKGPE